jgi:ribosomal protein L11 methyltransferase
LKTYPAISVRDVVDPDLLAAAVDDHSPTAIEQRDSDLRIFFASAGDRDAAHHALTGRFEVTAIDVPDDDWARRSQDNLQPITVGRITVFPNPESRIPHPGTVRIVILPSMGFGTGHHATTRLCLAALQAIDLTGCTVLDVGTGSGVLAIAAETLGAARAIGIDCDPDAIQSARENLDLNPAIRRVSFDLADLAVAALAPADVVTANLTGALLVRSAPTLLAAVRPGGRLIVSGLLAEERDEVCRAFARSEISWEGEEDGWIGLAVKKQ